MTTGNAIKSILVIELLLYLIGISWYFIDPSRNQSVISTSCLVAVRSHFHGLETLLHPVVVWLANVCNHLLKLPMFDWRMPARAEMYCLSLLNVATEAAKGRAGKVAMVCKWSAASSN